MSLKLRQVVARNWPLKLAALFFAVMLYIVVAAQQPITQTFALRLAIELPPGRSVRQQPAGIAVVISGKGSELLKLRSFSRVIRKAVPDTFSSSLWRLRLQPSDVPLPKGTDVQVVDITPRDLDVLLDSVVRKEVRIAPRVTVEAESGFVLQGLTILPSMAHIVGPQKSVAEVDSVTTVATVISSVNGPFFRTVPVDTAALGVVRVAPREVRVSGEVAPLGERVFPGIPVATAASGFAGFVLSSERVAVRVSGPAPRVDALTRDSLRVVAHLIGPAGPSAYARLTVVAPAGITAHAVPDSVALKRKTGRG